MKLSTTSWHHISGLHFFILSKKPRYKLGAVEYEKSFVSKALTSPATYQKTTNSSISSGAINSLELLLFMTSKISPLQGLILKSVCDGQL